jgi:L-malate glycosyltransferase
MIANKPLNIGITCYPTVGGSGVLACALGEELALRGHEIHFISYERPFRLPEHSPRVRFHAVEINDYGLFKYPDYTLPLSVKMAEVSVAHRLDVLHVHYAVPHATAAILAQTMLEPCDRPKIVTTLHGTDTTLLGRDAGYGPAISHALALSDAITTVSEFLRSETQRLLAVERPIDVIHNFFVPRPPLRTRQEVRDELGVRNETLLIHSSNLRSVKRIDLLLESVARVRPRDSFKLVVLAGGSFAPFAKDLRRLDLEDRVIVIDRTNDVEGYLQAADLGVYTSESESFCLSILEGMCFGCPSVAMRVGGIPEVVDDTVTGRLVPFGDIAAFVEAIEALVCNPAQRVAMGCAARESAHRRFAAEVIVPRYEALYHRVCGW